MIFTVTIFIVCWVSKCKYDRTRRISGFIALESHFIIYFWIYMITFMMLDENYTSATIAMCGMIANFAINWLWLRYYHDSLTIKDQSYNAYRDHYPKMNKLIVFFSFLVTFQFHRYSFCRLFNKKYLSATMEHKGKYYKRMNRYSLLQITVYVAMCSASVYNLFYTFWGRQVFWIDLENIIYCIGMTILLVKSIIGTERHYMFEAHDKYLIKGPAADLANEVNQFGFKEP